MILAILKKSGIDDNDITKFCEKLGVKKVISTIDYFWNKIPSDFRNSVIYLLKRLITVKSYIENSSNIEEKVGFDNFIPFFEMNGGCDMIQSNQGKKAI